MFVVLLHYTKPLAEVDRFVGEHREFLERYYASGHFLLSGRQEPRTGGVILAKGPTKAEIEHIIRLDPFYKEQIAEYQIVEFVPSMSDPQLASLKEL
ncbi:YciI family protein [Beijerinckia indica]|uniref:YCII-related n=1 Tax=Beijerinckia indica subsp. indica (strain ATCC 9039 / DSM 1715 / NCIMB 8712) TaxID=395963 RepID=B2IKA2_BEII9|nr:YciI family protein [Beijerinckia indica]ACB95034.1 YCII-related [Beijerinckia indica subsp. indica ATCC 9039]